MSHVEPLNLTEEHAREIYEALSTAIEWHREQIASLKTHKSRIGLLQTELNRPWRPGPSLPDSVVSDAIRLRIQEHSEAIATIDRRRSNVGLILTRCRRANADAAEALARRVPRIPGKLPAAKGQ